MACAPVITDAPIVALCVLVLSGLPDAALGVLSLAGAAVVLRLAWEALQPLPPVGGGDGDAPGDLRRAVLVNVLSPHPWLFWLTAGGPLLVDAGQRATWLAVAFVGGFYLMLVGAKLAIAGLAEAGRRRTGGRSFPRVSAALLVLAAAALVVEGAGRLA